jgi:hypothetical protein
MAIKFYNIRSKEIRVAETEPMIAAMWGSSDRSPNVLQGQDFGWRLAPEVVVRLKRIKADMRTLERIAVRYAIPLENVDERAILKYISDMTAEAEAPVAQEADYSDDYEAEIRELETKEKAAKSSTKKEK